jgi:hypothetical protein
LAQRVWRERKVPNRLLDSPVAFLRENGIEIPPGFDARVVAERDSISFRFEPIPGGNLDSGLAMDTIAGAMFFRFQFKLVWD